MYNKLASKLAVVAVGILTFNCVFVAAQLYGTNTYGNQPVRTHLGLGYAGVDPTGRYYGHAAGHGQYQLNGYDPSTGRRFEYGGAGYPGYDRDNVYGYGRQNGYGYGGRNYYGYYNGAVTSQKTGCVFWLTLILTTGLALKVFV